MMLRFFLVYAALFGVGALLVRLARSRDRDRDRPRTGALPLKFLSFILITAATLGLAWVGYGTRRILMFVFGMVILDELQRAAYPEGEKSPSGLAVWDLFLIWVWTTFPLLTCLISLKLNLFSSIAPDLSGFSKEEGKEVVLMRGRLQVLGGLAGFALVFALDPSGGAWCWLWFLVATSDGYAQLIGQSFGHTPFRPAVSPAKTREGVIGQVLTALLVGQLVSFALPLLDPFRLACLSLVTVYASLRGDLLASAMKRQLGIKDFSRLLGPHGGLMDRYDSVLGALPPFAITLLLMEWIL